MITFIEIINKFQDFKSLRGLAVFDKDGDIVDTSLPISDEYSDQIGSYFHNMVEEYRANGSYNNRIIVQMGENHFIYAEHTEGGFLFMLDDSHEIDAVVGAFTHIYPSSENKTEIVTKTEKTIEFVEVKKHQSEVVSHKKSFLVWALPTAAAAAVALMTIGPGVISIASADNFQESYVEEQKQSESLQLAASLEKEKEALLLKQKLEEAEEKASQAIQLAQKAKAEQEAERAKIAAEKEAAELAAKEAAQLEALKAVEEEVRRMEAEEAIALAQKEAEAVAKAEKAKKAAAKKAKKRSYSKKSSAKPHCMNDK